MTGCYRMYLDLLMMAINVILVLPTLPSCVSGCYANGFTGL